MVNEPAAASETLSPRQHEIMRLINAGKSNAEIAISLALSEHTVKAHVYRCFRVLGVSSRTRAAQAWRGMHKVNALTAGQIVELGEDVRDAMSQMLAQMQRMQSAIDKLMPVIANVAQHQLEREL